MKSSRNRKTKSPFTLIELLIVVAIIAVVAGGLIASYGSLDKQAQHGVAAHTQGALMKTIRAYAVVNAKEPQLFDSGIAIDQGSLTPGAVATGGEILKSIPSYSTGTKTITEFAGGTTNVTEWLDDSDLYAHTLSPGEADALTKAGITQLRFVEKTANSYVTDENAVNYVQTLVGVKDEVDGASHDVQPNLALADMPNRVFDDSRSGREFRGRGFTRTIGAGTKVLRFDPSDAGKHMRKMNADPSHVLVAFGVGNKSTLVSGKATVGMDEAPYYQLVEKRQYSRYFAVYDLGPKGAPFAKAKFYTVVDPHGEYLDEKINEYNGNKEP